MVGWLIAQRLGRLDAYYVNCQLLVWSMFLSITVKTITLWQFFCSIFILSKLVFSRVLRDSTPRFVSPSVGPLVRPSVRWSVRPSHFTFLFFLGIFSFTAPAQMIW